MPASPTRQSTIACSEAGIALDAIDHVAFYDKPLLKFERLLETYSELCSTRLPLLCHGHAHLAEGKAVSEVVCSTPSSKSTCPDFNWSEKLLFAEHHQSHAASAFFPSPFERSGRLDHGRCG